MDRDRGINTDQRLDTLVHFHEGASWEIDLPNGAYAVTAVVGDAQFSSTHTLNVEGVSYWTGLALPANQFALNTLVVTVSDGRLTLDQGSGADRATRINYIEITPVGSNFQLLPLASADLTLNGKLSYADVLAFGAGWGSHDPGATLDELVRAGDLNFARVTDAADWALFYQAWTDADMPALSLAAVLNPIAGDFDRNAGVNEGDFHLWRGTFGSTTELAADGNGDGTVDAADYVVWRRHNGDQMGNGAVSPHAVEEGNPAPAASEPATPAVTSHAFTSPVTVVAPI
jgi:hypothetical protein